MELEVLGVGEYLELKKEVVGVVEVFNVLRIERMDNKEFSIKLEKRAKDFALDVIKLTAQLPDSPEAKVIRYQLAKSGTSVGANYREANRSRSKADFKNKISISLAEASESGYWLEIIDEASLLEHKMVVDVLNEANEILAIFTSIRANIKM